MVPGGLIQLFSITWNRFRQLRRDLAYRPDDEARIYRVLDYASTGSPGMGPSIFSFGLLGDLFFLGF